MIAAARRWAAAGALVVALDRAGLLDRRASLTIARAVYAAAIVRARRR